MTDHDQPTGRFEDTVGYRALVGSVPPGDDTPAPTECRICHSDFCDHFPLRDDTPAPTAVDERRLYATTRADVWAEEFAKVRPDVDRDLMLGWFANAIETGRDAGRRAEAAPDLTALPTAEQVIQHINQSITFGGGEHPTEGLQLILDEEGQHEAVQAVLDAVAALVRSAQNDTDQ